MRVHAMVSFALILFAVAAVAATGQTGPSQIPVPTDVAAPPADGIKSKSGLTSKVLDSSHVRGKPSTLGVKRMLPGLGEGVQLMVVGESRRLWIPESLAYKG